MYHRYSSLSLALYLNVVVLHSGLCSRLFTVECDKKFGPATGVLLMLRSPSAHMIRRSPAYTTKVFIALVLVSSTTWSVSSLALSIKECLKFESFFASVLQNGLRPLFCVLSTNFVKLCPRLILSPTWTVSSFMCPLHQYI